jgi:hypothetical protein
MRIDNPQIFPALWIQAKDTDKSAGIRHQACAQRLRSLGMSVIAERSGVAA